MTVIAPHHYLCVCVAYPVAAGIILFIPIIGCSCKCLLVLVETSYMAIHRATLFLDTVVGKGVASN